MVYVFCNMYNSSYHIKSVLISVCLLSGSASFSFLYLKHQFQHKIPFFSSYFLFKMMGDVINQPFPMLKLHNYFYVLHSPNKSFGFEVWVAQASLYLASTFLLVSVGVTMIASRLFDH